MQLKSYPQHSLFPNRAKSRTSTGRLEHGQIAATSGTDKQMHMRVPIHLVRFRVQVGLHCSHVSGAGQRLRQQMPKGKPQSADEVDGNDALFESRQKVKRGGSRLGMF